MLYNDNKPCMGYYYCVWFKSEHVFLKMYSIASKNIVCCDAYFALLHIFVKKIYYFTDNHEIIVCFFVLNIWLFGPFIVAGVHCRSQLQDVCFYGHRFQTHEQIDHVRASLPCVWSFARQLGSFARRTTVLQSFV